MERLKRGKRNLVMLLIGGLLALVIYFMGVAYSSYTRLAVQERQENLLLVSRAVARNLQSCFSEQMRKVDILIQTPGFLEGMEAYCGSGDRTVLKEYIFSYMLSHQPGLAALYVLDKDGEPVVHYDQYPFVGDFDGVDLNLVQYRDAAFNGIGEIVGGPGLGYGITLVNNIYGGQGYMGTVVSVMDMDEIYSQYVQPLQPENQGYIEVKDENGTVIMHHSQGMLRFNCFRDLEGFETLPQYEDMRRAMESQYSREEGSAVYTEYSGNIRPPEKLLASFSRMNLNGEVWYVSAMMPFQAAMEIETESMRHLGILAAAILVLFLAGGLIIYRQQRERQKLTMETRYLRDMNRTLEELHQSQEQIRHYQKLTTIGMLAGGIVHEFNNLLTPVMGYSEFLMERLGKGSEYYEDIEEIYKAGARGKEIVEQILPFSRKEMDAAVFAPVSIDAVVEDALKAMQLLKPSSVKIEADLGCAGVNVCGSATQIHQILLNLYSNGCQAMEKEGGVLRVKTRRAGAEQIPEAYRGVAGTDYAQISISDTGCGMKREMLRQIFEPFFTTKASGTGLGMYVVKNIMVNHGGFILAESEPGRGSVFELYFPATEQPVSGQKIGGGGKTGRSPGSRGSVLLVDDDVQVVRYLSRRLRASRYRVEAYTDAQKAMDALGRRDGDWQIMIVDDTMPKYRGVALARRAKSRPGLRVVLITGLAGPEILTLRAQGIVDEILAKPLRFKELLAVMERLEAGEEENGR